MELNTGETCHWLTGTFEDATTEEQALSLQIRTS